LEVIENNQTWAVLEDGQIVSSNNYFLGGYSVGGFVWEVQDMEILEEFIPAKAHLGIWSTNSDRRCSYDPTKENQLANIYNGPICGRYKKDLTKKSFVR